MIIDFVFNHANSRTQVLGGLLLPAMLAMLYAPAASSAPWGLGHVPVLRDPTTEVSDCVVRATHKIALEGLFYGSADESGPDGQGCDLCPRSDYCAGLGEDTDGDGEMDEWVPGTGMIKLGGLSKAFVPFDAPALRDVAIYGYRIDMERISRMSDAIVPDPAWPDSGVYAQGVKIPVDHTEAGIRGPAYIREILTPDQLPALPPFPSYASTGPDIVIPPAGSLTLTPGNYGTLYVGPKATLNLDGPGDYIFKWVYVAEGALVDPIHDEDIAIPWTRILVEDFVSVREFVVFNPDDDPNDPTDDPTRPNKSVYIYVANPDGCVAEAVNDNEPGLEPSGCPAAFEYYGDREFNACYVYTPNGTSNLRGVGDPDGYDIQFIGKHFQGLNRKVQLRSPPKDQCPPFGEVAECGTIGRVTNSLRYRELIDAGGTLPTDEIGALKCMANGELQVKGWYLSLEKPATVWTLEFYKVLDNLPVNTVTRVPCYVLSTDSDELEVLQDPIEAIADRDLLRTVTGGNFAQELLAACGSDPVYPVLFAPISQDTSLPVCFSEASEWVISSDGNTCSIDLPPAGTLPPP